ncbi:MAG: hypothetical protein V1706_12865 [Pseudomonadota bacterium]
MNKKTVSVFLAAGIVLFGAGIAQAELIRRGPNLVYDAEKDITWYEAAYGPVDYLTARTYAENLVVKYDGMIYDDWRLPAAPQTSWEEARGFVGLELTLDPVTLEGQEDFGELAYLFYKELGNYSAAAPGENGESGLINTFPFKNLLPVVYWMSDEGGLYLNDNGVPTYSWFFNCATGFQGQLSKSSPFYVIAVRDGDIGAYSEPDSDIPEDCGDGIDNDGDGLVDCADHYSCDGIFNGVYLCTSIESKDLCGDGFDNDGDGLIDCQESTCCTVKRTK